MSDRLYLDGILREIPGVKKVYFTPPNSTKLVYPCILYSLDGMNNVHADNKNYRVNKRYLITVIDTDPDSEIPDVISELPYCSLSRPPYVSDGLYHFIFEIYI